MHPKNVVPQWKSVGIKAKIIEHQSPAAQLAQELKSTPNNILIIINLFRQLAASDTQKAMKTY